MKLETECALMGIVVLTPLALWVLFFASAFVDN